MDFVPFNFLSYFAVVNFPVARNIPFVKWIATRRNKGLDICGGFLYWPKFLTFEYRMAKYENKTGDFPGACDPFPGKFPSDLPGKFLGRLLAAGGWSQIFRVRGILPFPSC